MERLALNSDGLRRSAQSAATVPQALALVKWINAQNGGKLDNRIEINGGELLLQGILTPGIAKHVTKILDENTAIRVLRINSLGGSLGEGVRLGALLKERGLHLVVDGFCGSACANPIAYQADSVELQGALLLHGSPIGCLRTQTMGAMMRNVGFFGAGVYLLGALKEYQDNPDMQADFEELLMLTSRRDRGFDDGTYKEFYAPTLQELRRSGFKVTSGEVDNFLIETVERFNPNRGSLERIRLGPHPQL